MAVLSWQTTSFQSSHELLLVVEAVALIGPDIADGDDQGKGIAGEDHAS